MNVNQLESNISVYIKISALLIYAAHTHTQQSHTGTDTNSSATARTMRKLGGNSVDDKKVENGECFG